jgi:hypothetical protein
MKKAVKKYSPKVGDMVEVQGNPCTYWSCTDRRIERCALLIGVVTALEEGNIVRILVEASSIRVDASALRFVASQAEYSPYYVVCEHDEYATLYDSRDADLRPVCKFNAAVHPHALFSVLEERDRLNKDVYRALEANVMEVRRDAAWNRIMGRHNSLEHLSETL